VRDCLPPTKGSGALGSLLCDAAMPKSEQALVTPELLRWGRDTAGLDVDAAARKAGVEPDRVERWERGDARPTVAQLRNLARIYKRPLAAFYLPEPPPPLPALREFRRPEAAARPRSPALRLAHRQAAYRRQGALELLEEIGERPPAFRLSADPDGDPEGIAAHLRTELRITCEQQAGWSDHYDALNAWRSACEDAGTLVCQAADVEQEEMSGFSIGEFPLPVVVANIKDVPQRRVFTLLHEIVHLAMRHGGLCDLDERPGRTQEAHAIEVFCNRVAGAILVPLDDLRGQEVVRGTAGRASWSDEGTRALARRYNVSWEVVLRRLLVAGLIGRDFYTQKREEYARGAEGPRSRSGEGGASQAQKALSRTGPSFARIVLDAYRLDHITASDVAGYLAVRVKHLPEIESALWPRGRPEPTRPGARP
jgi:Zn-dependent peptidase ImmA (M78 family)/DNA-binding transcriptional regulator YiaG